MDRTTTVKLEPITAEVAPEPPGFAASILKCEVPAEAFESAAG